MTPSISLRAPGSRQPFSPDARIQASPFVGADLTPTPHASAHGALIRLVRLNGLRPSDLASLFGIRVPRAQDLGAIMTFSDARQVKFAAALRLSDVPASWNLSLWFPFSAPSSLMKDGWQFRYCPECLRVGYHVHLHQLPWFERCPWHGAALATTCNACSDRIDTSANWLTGHDMTCRCGHTLIDTSAAIEGVVGPPPEAAAFLDAYLDWAARERGSVTLAGPDSYEAPASLLGAVVTLPRRWQPWAPAAGPFHARLWANTGRPAPGALQTLAELETLRRDRPGFLKLSPDHANACAQVAADLALKLPAETLSDGEMSLFLAGAGINAPTSFDPARRPFSAEVSSMVPWQTSAGNFLNLTCLHPAAYRPLVELLDAFMGAHPRADFHAQAHAGELDLLLRCCRDVLARGYAEGLRSVLAPHVPALWDMRRDRPHLCRPWLLVRRKNGRIASVRAVWEPLNLNGRQAPETIEAADLANRRRERCSSLRRKKK